MGYTLYPPDRDFANDLVDCVISAIVEFSTRGAISLVLADFRCVSTTVTRFVRTRSSLCMENEQADAGRDGQTCVARPNSQARTGTGGNSFALLNSPRAEDWQACRLMPNLLYSMISQVVVDNLTVSL